MTFNAPPRDAAWVHVDARSGFEVVYFHGTDTGWRIEGCTTAVEAGESWIVDYRIELDAGWTTRRAHVAGRSVSGRRETALEADGGGRWLVDGMPAPHLDGCLDIDLESSAMTNALPVHRLGLAVGAAAAAPAAYVRAGDLAVVRLEQRYLRNRDESGRQRFDYEAPAFEFACLLSYDESGLVLDYPGIAVRAG